MTSDTAETIVVSVFSRPWRLVEWSRYLIDDDPAKSVPDLVTGDGRPSYVPVRNKWVYVFQKLGTKTEWIAEIYVSRAGRIFWPEQSQVQDKEPAARPTPEADGGEFVTLAHTICGKRAYHALFVSRCRLPLASIDQLKKHTGMQLPLVDTSEIGPLGVDEQGSWLLGALDPVTIALDLHDQYMTALTDRLGFTIPYEGHSERRQKEAVTRRQLHFVACAFRDLMKQDPADKTGVKAVLDKQRSVQKFLHDHDENLRILSEVVEARAKELCLWLDSPLITLVREAFAALPDAAFAEYLPIYAACTTQLPQCAEGRRYLGEVLEDQSHFIYKYVIPPQQPGKDEFAVTRKAVQSVMEVWETVAEQKLAGLKGQRVLVEAIQRELIVSLERVVTTQVVQLEPATRVIWLSEERLYRQVRISYKRFVFVEPAAPVWAGIKLEGSGLKKFKDHLAHGLEIINATIAIDEVMHADGADLKWKGLNLLGAALDLGDAFGPGIAAGRGEGALVYAASEKWLKRFGILSAIIDAVLYGKEAYSNVFDRHDYSVGAGFGMMATGSVAFALGLTGRTLLRFRHLYFLIAGGVLLTLGGVITLMTKDPPIKTFAEHSFFGIHRGSGGEEPYCGSLATLHEDAARQVQALLAIVSSFAVKTHGEDIRTIRVYLGFVHPESRLHVHFNFVLPHDRRFRTRLVVDLGEQRLSHEAGPEADLSKVAFGEEDGCLFVDVGAYYPGGTPPDFLSGHCWLYLEAPSDAGVTARVPWYPKKEGRLWLHHPVSAWGLPATGTSSSLDEGAIVKEEDLPSLAD